MPRIPVSIDSLSTERTNLDEAISYNVICRSCKQSDEPDKNGNYFLTGITLEVTEPDAWVGRRIFANYIPIPEPITPGMTLGEQRAIEDQGVELARMIKALKVPYNEEGFDPDDAVGCQGQVMVRNEEYQGKMNPRVQDWLL